MDGIANVARQQQSQMSTPETQGRATQSAPQTQQQAPKEDLVKQMQNEVTRTDKKIDTKEQVQDLIKQLNDALSPISTSIKFGFDNDDEVFFVSVIESKSNRMIRRFPAEQAMDFLPKMQEVTGILFDSKG